MQIVGIKGKIRTTRSFAIVMLIVDLVGGVSILRSDSESLIQGD